MTKLRAGVVGLGMMGRHHVRVLRSLPGVELAALADEHGDIHSVAQGLPVVSTVEQLLEYDLDYCVISVPTAFHEQVGITVARAGVHALIEKPLAFDTAGAKQLAQEFSARGLVAAVGHVERFNAAIQQARKRIAAGDIGEVYQVATRRQGPFPRRIADVGVVKDLGTHDIDLTAWVVDQSYVSVAAQTAHRSGREHEDLVAAVGLLTGEVVSNHLVNWLSPLKERVTIITGERGTFAADTLSADLTFFANGDIPTTWTDLAQFRGVSEGDVVRFAYEKPEPLRVEHENFRDAVLGRSAGIVTLDEGLGIINVAEALIEAARSGQTVAVSAP